MILLKKDGLKMCRKLYRSQPSKQSKLTTFAVNFFSQQVFIIEKKAIPLFKDYEIGFQKKILLSETTHNILEYIN